MGLKNRTSDWEIKENLESLCLHLLSSYLLHLSLLVSQSTWLLPDLTRLHSIVQKPREKEPDFLSQPPLFSLVLFPSPTPPVSKCPGREMVLLGSGTYTRTNQLWRESNVTRQKNGSTLQSNRMGERDIPKEWVLANNPRESTI